MDGFYHIVIVEDNEEDQLIYKRYISQQFTEMPKLTFFQKGQSVLEFTKNNLIDCILMDYLLPDMTGIDVLKLLTENLEHVPPVVMLTGAGNENVAVEALKLGAYDYIIKSNLRPELLYKAIYNAIEKELLSRNIQVKEKELNFMSANDPLTGLINHATFKSLLDVELKENPTSKIAVLMIDLDRFKNINEIHSHDVGDQLLQEVALRFSKFATENNVVSRFGGDEFSIFMKKSPSDNQIKELINKILSSLQSPVVVNQLQIYITPSIGIAIYPDAGITVAQLLQRADTALFVAKRSGKNTYKFYDSSLSDVVTDQAMIENCLRNAIVNKEMSLVYHPIVDIKDNSFYALETLVRWNSSELGVVPPDKFIPTAEEVGLIVPIGNWILDTALAQFKTWCKTCESSFKLTLNLSPVQLLKDDWFIVFKEKLKKFDINPSQVIIELTETAIVKEFSKVRVVLRRLSDLGCIIFLDDFGTGFSSMNLIRKLPISGLKIDKSYVSDMDKDVADAKLVKAILAFANSMDLLIIAEGVETESQLNIITENSNAYIQGFYLYKPLCAEDITHILEQNSK